MQGWNGDNSGSAALLASFEASWAAVASRQAEQLAAATAADEAVADLAAQLRSRAEAWTALQSEATQLPELQRNINALTARTAALLAACDTLSTALDNADAGTVAMHLRARAVAEERAAAAAEARHVAALEALAEQRRSWAAHAAAAQAQLPAHARQAAAQLQRRLQGAPIHGEQHSLLNEVRSALGAAQPAVPASLSEVEVDLSDATAKLRRFLDGSPAPAPSASAGVTPVSSETRSSHGGDADAVASYQGYQDPAALLGQEECDLSVDDAGAEEEDTRVPTRQGPLIGASSSASE